MTHGVPVQAGQQTRFREVWFQWNVLETHIIYIYMHGIIAAGLLLCLSLSICMDDFQGPVMWACHGLCRTCLVSHRDEVPLNWTHEVTGMMVRMQPSGASIGRKLPRSSRSNGLWLGEKLEHTVPGTLW